MLVKGAFFQKRRNLTVSFINLWRWECIGASSWVVSCTLAKFNKGLKVCVDHYLSGLSDPEKMPGKVAKWCHAGSIQQKLGALLSIRLSNTLKYSFSALNLSLYQG